MRVLLDHNLPRKLKNHLSPHESVLTQEAGWNDLENGKLLAAAQETFEVLLTTDTNIYHQQNIERFDIAIIVLRAYNNKYESLRPLMTGVLSRLEAIDPGKIYYIYVDEELKEIDRRRGKGTEAE